MGIDIDADTRELVVRGAGGIRLAVTDRPVGTGGTGHTIVLMPGLGLTQSSLARVTGELGARGWRVVTMDQRGHGGSDTAPWTFEAAVEDLLAVVDHLGLETPYVGGHSLGGMVALRYAMAGHPTAGAVNIDGWGPGQESRFPGEDPADVAAQLDRWASGWLPPIARVVTCWTRQARQGTTREVMGLLRHADLVAWHREAPCPSLAFNGVAPPLSSMGVLMGKDMVRLQLAHRRGLQRDLAEVARERDDVAVCELDATHGMHLSHPGEVAAAIDAFASVER